MMGAEVALAAFGLGLQAGGIGLSIYGQLQQGKAAQQAAEYNAAVARNQAAWARWKAEKDALRIRARAEALRKRQEAFFAAHGIDPPSVSPLQVLEETTRMGELDALATLRGGAARTGSYMSQAGMYEAAGVGARRAATIGAFAEGVRGAGSLLSQGAQVGHNWVQSGRLAKLGAGDVGRGW